MNGFILETMKSLAKPTLLTVAPVVHPALTGLTSFVCFCTVAGAEQGKQQQLLHITTWLCQPSQCRMTSMHPVNKNRKKIITGLLKKEKRTGQTSS
jgi:hypothetical protein